MMKLDFINSGFEELQGRVNVNSKMLPMVRTGVNYFCLYCPYQQASDERDTNSFGNPFIYNKDLWRPYLPQY